ncbi:MAG: hypothetical protein FWG14_12925, partial [Peptococcaceae bacterium]|nr:hypothetical protein [Peptococcaceae bacterium]
AAQAILDKNIQMNQCRGQWFKRGNTMMMPLWHPGSLLRSPLRREICVEYLRKVKEVCKAASPAPAASRVPDTAL